MAAECVAGFNYSSEFVREDCDNEITYHIICGYE